MYFPDMYEHEQFIVHYPFRGLQRLIVPFRDFGDDPKGTTMKPGPSPVGGGSPSHGIGLQLPDPGILQFQRQPLFRLIE
jgi:hypothetical protein